MSDLFKIFLTSGLTIFGGIFVYCISQLISKFIIEPIQEQKKLLARIGWSSFHYSIKCSVHKHLSKEEQKIASHDIMKLYSSLLEVSSTIPFYNFFEKIRFVERKSTIGELSNGLYRLADLFLEEAPDHGKMINEFGMIKEILKLYDPIFK